MFKILDEIPFYPVFLGRTQIFTDEIVTVDNAISVLNTSICTHNFNRGQIEYLYQYYKGNQPIVMRTRTDRSDICNKLVVNRANEIVSFKDGYLLGEPIQYISRGDSDSKSDEVNQLNSYMDIASKAAEDMDLVGWLHICGVAYRLVLPTGDIEQPFDVITLDPRNTFIVYLNDVRKTPQMAVNYVTRNDGKTIYTCYLKDKSFQVLGTAISEKEIEFEQFGDVVIYSSPIIPIVEYIANKERMGAFESVLSILDAINTTESNRLDGVEQFIQAILVFFGVDPSQIDFDEVRKNGGLALPNGSDGSAVDVKYLIQELNQQQTQTLVDNFYDEVLTICGMPNRNGSSSTSDTGSAVILRDGWGAAEGRAKAMELLFNRSERNVLKAVLEILRVNTNLELALKDIEIKFTRRNYENLTIKVNALVAMLNNGKIHPLDAYQSSGLFIDPEAAYERGKSYAEETADAILLRETAANNITEGADANSGNTETDSGNSKQE